MKLEVKLEHLRKLSVDLLTQLQEQNKRENELNRELERVKESESRLKGELEKEKDLRQKDKEDQANQLVHEKRKLMADLQQINC